MNELRPGARKQMPSDSKPSGATAIALLAIAAWISPVVAQSPTPPNVLLIMTDDNDERAGRLARIAREYAGFGGFCAG